MQFFSLRCMNSRHSLNDLNENPVKEICIREAVSPSGGSVLSYSKTSIGTKIVKRDVGSS